MKGARRRILSRRTLLGQAACGSTLAASSTLAGASDTVDGVPLAWFDFRAPDSRYYDRLRPLAFAETGAQQIVNRLLIEYQRTQRLQIAEWALVYGYNWWRVAPLGKTRIRIARIGRKIAEDVERRFPEDPVGPFWAASYAGLEGLARGVLDALNLVPDNLARLKRIDDEFPEYFYGGAALLLGKAYIKIPPFPLSIGNLAKGFHYLEKARPCQEGRIAMWYLFFAEAVYLRTGDADRAIAILDRIETDVRPIDAAGRYALETARVDAASFRRVLREGRYNKYTWDPLLTQLRF